MFEVIWTDPNVEHVGQRKRRKEQEAKDKDKKKTDSGRQSVSTASSSSSDRPFGLFANKSRRGTPAPSRGKPETSMYDREEIDDMKAQRTLIHGVKATLADRDESVATNTNRDWQSQPVQPLETEEAYPNSRRGMSDNILVH
jgi:hypothetical protein